MRARRPRASSTKRSDREPPAEGEGEDGDPETGCPDQEALQPVLGLFGQRRPILVGLVGTAVSQVDRGGQLVVDPVGLVGAEATSPSSERARRTCSPAMMLTPSA